MKFSVELELNDLDLLYLINCISLTMNTLDEGNPNRYYKLFQKNEYFDHYNNLFFLRKKLEIAGNKEIYGSNYYYMYWGQYIYFRENSCLELYAKNYKKYDKEIKDYNKRDSIVYSKTNLEKEQKRKIYLIIFN